MGGEKNFSAAREKQNPEKKYCRPIFFWKISGGARKREQSEGKTEAAQKIAERDFLSFDFPDIRAFEA